MSPEQRGRWLRHGPGMLVAEEAEKILGGKCEPLTHQDVAETSPVLAQAAQAVTPIPGVVWKRVFRRLLPKLHPGFVNIAGILVGAALPIIVYLNGRSLADFLIAHGLFNAFDWIRSVLQ